MKRILLATVAIAALVPSWDAHAQDMWSGAEIGLQGGYAFDGSSGNIKCPGVAPITLLTGIDGGEGGGGSGACGGSGDHSYHFSPGGVIGGAHAGYNWLWGNIVFGVEGDAEGAGVSGTDTSQSQGFSVHTSMDFDASVRGKLGWAFNNILLYGTGGVAFGDVRTSYQVAGVAGGPLVSVGSSDGTRVGWTGGAGIAYAFSSNWQGALEYRYTDLGTKSFSNPTAGVTDSNEYNFSAVRLSITYRFGPQM